MSKQFRKEHNSSADGGGERNEVPDRTSNWVYFGVAVLIFILIILIFG